MIESVLIGLVSVFIFGVMSRRWGDEPATIYQGLVVYLLSVIAWNVIKTTERKGKGQT